MSSKSGNSLYIPDLDAAAAEFLSSYGYEELVETPAPIPIRVIAEHKMQLKIDRSQYLSNNSSVCGAVIFVDGDIDVYDYFLGSIVPYWINCGTILVDAAIGNEGRYRNVLAHECFHWHKHRHLFTGSDAVMDGYAICCPETLQIQKTDTISVYEQIEYQANRIAPRILMPRIAFQKKTQEIETEILKKENPHDYLTFMRLLITRIAEFFHVSLQSASIRLKDIHYEITNTKLQKHLYIPKNMYMASINNKQEIDIENAFHLAVNNPDLARHLIAGSAVFIEGLFILNKPECFEKNKEDEKVHLSRYAIKNLNWYSLDVAKIPVKIFAHQYPDYGPILYRRNQQTTNQYAIFPSDQTKRFYTEADVLEKLEKQYTNQLNNRENYKTANQTLFEQVEKMGWSSGTFSQRTHLGSEAYRRLKEPHYQFSLPAYVAIAIALHIPYLRFLEIIQLAGYMLSPQNPEHIAYSIILGSPEMDDIYKCNEFLEKIGIKPLGRKMRY